MPSLSRDDMMLLGELGSAELRFHLNDLMQLLQAYAIRVDEECRENPDVAEAAMSLVGEAVRMIDRWRQP